MKVHGHHYHRCENPWDEAPPWALELGFVVGLLLRNTESIMAVSQEVQDALDLVRQTKSLAQSVDAGVKVNNTLIVDLQKQIADLQTGQVLSVEDKAALAETAQDLKDVNTQLASDIPAGVTTP